MSINLNGKYGNVGSDTLKMMDYALKNDGKVDAAEVNSIEAGAKADNNYSQGEKDLVAKLRALTKDGNEIQNLKLSGFDPASKSLNFTVNIKNNIASVSSENDSAFLIPKKFNNGNLTFTLSSEKELSPGIKYAEFSTPADNKKTVRAVLFDPKNAEFNVQHGKKTFKAVASQDIAAAVNGVTMVNYLAQGDIKGIDSKGNVSVYQLEKNQTASNARYSLGIKNDGTVEFVKGGLQGSEPRANANKPSDYKAFMNGAALLFDKDNFSSEEEFNKKFESRHDKSLVNNMRVSSDVPRTAVGLTKEGKVVMVTFGEGKNRWEKGATGFEMYKTLKAMGIEKALMLDGGGAPAMVTKDSSGKASMTTPSESHGYNYNSSFLTVKGK